MAQVATKAFGTIEINPMQIIRFPDGLYGFKESAEFALLDDAAGSPFKWLQSMADPTLAFVLIQPELFLKDEYDPRPTREDLEVLQLTAVGECLIFLIVTIPENNPENMTANLQGPLLINKEKKIGRQIISNNSSHTVRVSIMEQLEG